MVGVGHRRELASWIDTRPPELDCLEVTAEHFFRPDQRHRLERLQQHYPLMVHSLGLSLGTPGPINREVLASLAEVVAVANPLWISDHVGFCRTDEVDLGHFNPVCPDEETVQQMADHIREVADTCGRPVIVENITSELQIRGTLSETEFLNRLCEAADCGLLFDVTNLLVNSRNHGFDPRAWMRDLEPGRIVQLHVVGYSRSAGHWYDFHGESIQDDLWELIKEALAYANPRAVILERDKDFPPVMELEKELRALRGIVRASTHDRDVHAATPGA